MGRVGLYRQQLYGFRHVLTKLTQQPDFSAFDAAEGNRWLGSYAS